MIKSIVCDMDGTMLNENKELPAGIYEMVAALKQQGILFGIASGRQYANIRSFFEPIAQDVLFLAENGTYVVYQDEVLSIAALDKTDVANIINMSRELEDVALVLCGGERAYVFTKEERYLTEIRKYYAVISTISSLEEIVEPLIKVAVLDLQGSEHHCYPHYRGLTHLEVVVSAAVWMDIHLKGVNKGTSLSKTLAHFSLSTDSCMAIGDYMNDYEMMQAVGYAVAMDNAHPEIKKICNYQTTSNEDNGVMNMLVRVLHHQI
ncbi:MAG: HAD family hydrolase [Erysipelotrichaceae bacterium]